MRLLTNYHYAEMLCNLISQTLFSLKTLQTSDPNLLTAGTLSEFHIIQFGASRGSGHTTTIEALTNIYDSDIICANKRQQQQYQGMAANTKVLSWDEARTTGIRGREVEAVLLIIGLILQERKESGFGKT